MKKNHPWSGPFQVREATDGHHSARMAGCHTAAFGSKPSRGTLTSLFIRLARWSEVVDRPSHCENKPIDSTSGDLCLPTLQITSQSAVLVLFVALGPHRKGTGP
jgi:hypothetical protein